MQFGLVSKGLSVCDNLDIHYCPLPNRISILRFAFQQLVYFILGYTLLAQFLTLELIVLTTILNSEV